MALLFLDLKVAFDTVDRKKLYGEMERKGVINRLRGRKKFIER